MMSCSMLDVMIRVVPIDDSIVYRRWSKKSPVADATDDSNKIIIIIRLSN